jgi:hypothetical protein
MVVVVLLLEQSEGFFGAECCHTSKILHAEAVENLGSLQVAYAQTQRTFDSFVRHWCSAHVSSKRIVEVRMKLGEVVE